jgi:hypothetical protein
METGYTGIDQVLFWLLFVPCAIVFMGVFAGALLAVFAHRVDTAKSKIRGEGDADTGEA